MPIRIRVEGLLDLIIFFMLLALMVLVAIPYGTVEPWWRAVFESAIYLLTALWIVHGLLRGGWRVSGLHLLLPFLALVVLTFVQTISLGSTIGIDRVEGIMWPAISTDLYETRLVAFRLLALSLFLALLLRFTSSPQRLRALIYVVIGIGVASALFGIVRQTTQHEPGFILPYLQPNIGYGQFINYNHFAFLMEMSLGLTLGIVIRGGAPHERVFLYLAAAAPVWTALVLSNSRGGIFSMLSQMLFIALLFTVTRASGASSEPSISASIWLWNISKSLAFRIVLIALLMLGVAFSIIWLGGEPLTGRLELVKNEIGTAESNARENVRRVDIWRATRQLIKIHPIAGIGFGGYWTAIPKYHDASGILIPQEAHNDYLELLASGGLIGVALFAWFLIASIRRARECLRSKDTFRRAACFGALVGLFGVAIHSMFDFGLHLIINALVFTSLLVIATVDSRVEKQASQSDRIS